MYTCGIATYYSTCLFQPVCYCTYMIHTQTLEKDDSKRQNKVIHIKSQDSNLSKKNCCLGWDLDHMTFSILG